MGILRCVVIGLVGVAVCVGSARAADDAQRRVLRQAGDDFTRGLGLAGDRPAEAHDAFESAARRYGQLAESVPSAALRYNEGTAWLRAGDAGRAIVALRRAQRLGGAHDDRIANNLALARERVRTDAGWPSGGMLGSVAGALPAAWLAGLGVGLFSLGWVLAAARLLGARAPVGAMVGAWVVSAGCIGLFVVGHRALHDPAHAVVVAQETTARLGPDESAYEPAFSASLTSGVEVRIVDERSGWAMIELADGREAWVRAGDVERI